MIYLFIFAISFVFSLILTILLKNLAKKKIVNLTGIPYLGGLSILLSVVLTLIVILGFALPLDKVSLGILSASGLILILGLVDDFRELSPLIKFCGQTLVVIVLIVFGVRTQIMRIGLLLNIIITIIWILAITNAFSLLDIMDGLSAGLVVISSITFFILAYISGNFVIATVSIIVAATTLGFLVFNLPQAKIYLGNSGSMFLGFILAGLAITISYAPIERKIALLTPILVLGLPIYDLLFVILMRLFKGKSPIRKSRDHFALRLLAMGRTKRQTLLIMYGFGILFSISALVISQVSNKLGLLIIFLVGSVCLLAGKKISRVRID